MESRFGVAPFAIGVQMTCTGSEQHASECKLTSIAGQSYYAGVQCEESEHLTIHTCILHSWWKEIRPRYTPGGKKYGLRNSI